MLLLDLNLADVAGMLNDLGNVGLVSATNFTSDALAEVGKSTVHPVLPEHTDAVAKGRKVGLDHAEGAVNGPEDEEDDEQVVGVPEALKVRTPRLLRSCECDRHQSHEHDISTPARASREVGQDEAHESEVVTSSESGKVVPMRNGVDPGEEDDGPRDQLVESDVLVERNDIVERCSTSHRN